MLKLISLFFIFESLKLIHQRFVTHPFDNEKLLHVDVCLGPLVCMFWLDWVLRDNLAKLRRIGVYINSPSQNHRARSLSSPRVYLDCVTGSGWLLLLGSLRISDLSPHLIPKQTQMWYSRTGQRDAKTVNTPAAEQPISGNVFKLRFLHYFLSPSLHLLHCQWFRWFLKFHTQLKSQYCDITEYSGFQDRHLCMCNYYASLLRYLPPSFLS